MNDAHGFPKIFLAGQDWPGLVDALKGEFTQLINQRAGYKQAASSLFSKKDLDDHEPPDTHFMIHQTVMGDQERYGENSNGDAWPGEGLAKYHPTFVTHGHVFREHKNHDPKHKIGDIKAARYSKRNGRVELLKWLDKDLAPKEYEMAKAGKELLASQASRVPYDLCSCCDHKAKNTSLYCGHLKTSMRQWLPKYKKYAFAINPIATFFDSSVVENPAAREARHIEYRFGKELAKAASASHAVISGADRALADGVTCGTVLSLTGDEQALLLKLAAVERGDTPADFNRYRDVIAAGAFDQHKLNDTHVEAMRKMMPRNLWRKCATANVMLPFDVFLAYTLDTPLQQVREDPDYTKCAAALPGIFRELVSSVMGGDTCCGQEELDLFSPSAPGHEHFDPGKSDYVDKLFDNVTDECSVKAKPLHARCISIVQSKAASAGSMFGQQVTPHVNPLLELYALYKLAAIRDMIPTAEYAADVLCALAVTQNASS